MSIRWLLVLSLFFSGQSLAQESGNPPGGSSATGNEDRGDQDLDGETDPREELAIELRDAYWEKNDKKGVKRKAEPELFDTHHAMTKEWVEKLKESDFAILRNTEPDEEEAKRAKELERIYNRKSADVLVQISLYKKLAKKITQAHWKRMNQNGVSHESHPEFASEFDETVNGWFKNRTVEDLRIFEKPKPTEAERDRGAKITKELLEKIEEVKKKHGVS